MRAAVLCNDADVAPEGGDWRPEGDPLEAALVAFALKAGVDPAAERSQAPRTDALPFDAERRWMATIHDDGGETLLTEMSDDDLLRVVALDVSRAAVE